MATSADRAVTDRTRATLADGTARRLPPADGDRAPALLVALGELAEAADSLTHAIEGHDLAGLLAAIERAETLGGRVDELAAGFTDLDRARLDPVRFAAVRDRLTRAARRNAYLIEQAWALDAATLRLLASLGRPPAETPVAPYAPSAAAGCLDRQA